jgi:hypothetical protein
MAPALRQVRECGGTLAVLPATITRPGAHGCPCAQPAGYAHQLGRAKSLIGLLEHVSESGDRARNARMDAARHRAVLGLAAQVPG